MAVTDPPANPLARVPTTNDPMNTGAQSGASNNLQNLAAVVAPVTGGGASSMYGLDSSIAKAPVIVGGLFPVNNADGTMTAEEVMKALAHADPGTIAQIQSWLYKSGQFYSNGKKWQDIDLGVLSPDDISAMGKAITSAAQTGASLTDYLQRQAAWGVYSGAGTGQGGSSGATSMSGSKILSIDVADPKKIGAIIDSEFRQLLGHKPSPAERAGFIAAYQAAERQRQISNYNRAIDATTGGSAAGMTPAHLPPQLEPYDPAAAALADDPGALRAMGQESSAATKGLVNTPLGLNPYADNAERNRAAMTRDQELVAQDQRYLALANQPLPGMPGYSTSGGSSSVTTVAQQSQYDPVAYADEWINTHHTAEAGAHSATDVFSNFLNIIKGGMR